MSGRPILVLQLLGTLAAVAFVPSNPGKTIVLLVLWAVTFRRVERVEVVLFVAACAVFTTMNALALDRGVFFFTQPDLLGMPAYELVMWGFYLVHTRRMLGGTAPPARWRTTVPAAVLFAACFAVLPDQRSLLVGASLVLVLMLVLSHDRLDMAYVAYMVALGAAVEFTGVLCGQWGYPGDPPLGVPLWFIAMWGGVGWLLRRLVLPALDLLPVGRRATGVQGARP